MRLFFAASIPALLLYLSTLAPTVTAEDSGELITAAYTLGIAHPPGYPLWCVLGKLFTILPIGTVAWRVNLLSAVLGAASVGLLALICHRFTKSIFVSLIAALMFAGSKDFWSQCVIAEVYTLNVFLFLLLLFLVLRFEDAYRTRWLYLAAFFLGLGLTNHSTLGPLAPVFFGWVFLRHLCLFSKPILLLNLLAAFLLGFSIVLYLPLRSAPDPIVDWGNPETLSATFDHLLRRQYAGVAQPQPRTLGSQAILIFHFLGSFAAQFTPVIAPLALLGALENARKDRSSFRLLTILFGLTSYGFIWLLSYRPDRESLYLTQVYFLPAHAVGAIWIAQAFKVLTDAFLKRYSVWKQEGLQLRFSLLGGLFVLFPLFAHYKHNDQSQNYLAEDWGRNVFACLKPNSIILPSADHSTFPIIYLQAVEGMRGDVLIGDKYGYIEDRVFRELFEGKDTPHVPPPLGGAPDEKHRYLIEHSGRPVYFSTKIRIPGLETHELVTTGLIFEAVKKGTEAKEEDHRGTWESFRWHPGSLGRMAGDFASDLILSDYHYARGRYALHFSRYDEALQDLRVSERYGFGIKEIHNNLGGTLAESRRAEQAIPFLKNALTVDPDYEMAIRNLTNAYFSLKRYRDGLPYFERAIEIDPVNPLPHLGKARAEKEEGRLLNAYFSYLQVLKQDPRDNGLREEALEVATTVFGKESALIRHLAEKPKLSPTAGFLDEGLPFPPPMASQPELPWPQPLQPDPLVPGSLSGLPQ